MHRSIMSALPDLSMSKWRTEEIAIRRTEVDGLKQVLQYPDAAMQHHMDHQCKTVSMNLPTTRLS